MKSCTNTLPPSMVFMSDEMAWITARCSTRSTASVCCGSYSCPSGMRSDVLLDKRFKLLTQLADVGATNLQRLACFGIVEQSEEEHLQRDELKAFVGREIDGLAKSFLEIFGDGRSCHGRHAFMRLE